MIKLSGAQRLEVTQVLDKSVSIYYQKDNLNLLCIYLNLDNILLVLYESVKTLTV